MPDSFVVGKISYVSAVIIIASGLPKYVDMRNMPQIAASYLE